MPPALGKFVNVKIVSERMIFLKYKIEYMSSVKSSTHRQDVNLIYDSVLTLSSSNLQKLGSDTSWQCGDDWSTMLNAI